MLGQGLEGVKAGGQTRFRIRLELAVIRASFPNDYRFPERQEAA
jgi:hypothetical protein